MNNTMVTLKNGEQVLQQNIDHRMISLKSLLQYHPVSFGELRRYCDDDSYQIQTPYLKVLCGYGLLESDETVSSDVKNIVKSAVTTTKTGYILNDPKKVVEGE